MGEKWGTPNRVYKPDRHIEFSLLVFSYKIRKLSFMCPFFCLVQVCFKAVMNMTTQSSQMDIKWELKAFSDLTLNQLYTIMSDRQAIFIVEQDCPFQDMDGLDSRSWHLTGAVNNRLVAYARIVFPGVRYPNPSIGRVLTTQQVRGQGVGRLLMKEAVRHCCRLYPGRKISLSAQIHLESFYEEFGFHRVSEPYDEDGIMHIDMEKN